MLNFKIQVTPSFSKLGNAFKNVNMKDILEKINEEVAFAIESYAKQVTPVDTGRLRASINVSNQFGNSIKTFVAPHTEYAYLVHEGLGSNKYKGRRPYMEWGTNFAMQKYSGDTIGWRLDRELRKQLSMTGI